MADDYSDAVATFAPPAPPPAAENDGNPYEAVARELQESEAQRAQATTYVNSDANPERAAQAQQIGKQMGVAPSIVEPNLPDWKRQAQGQKNGQILAGNPALASWVNTNPEATRVSHDDFDKLDFISKTIHAAKSGLLAGAYENELARKQYADIGTGQVDPTEAPLQAQIAGLDDADGSFFRGLHNVAGFIGGLNEMVSASLPEAAGGAALGTGAELGIPGPGTLAGAGIGLTAGLVKEGFITGAGQLYGELRQMKDNNGKPLDPDVAAGAAYLGGLGIGALNAVGFSEAAKPVIDGVKAAIPGLAAKLMAKPTITRALLDTGKSIARSGLTGAAFGAVSQIANEAAVELAKQADGGQWDTLFNSEEARDEATSRIADSAAEMALTFGALHVGPVGLSLGSDLLRARQAYTDRSFLQNLADGSAGSATRGRSADLFRDFVAAQADGSPVENLYVPAAKVMELYQSAGVTPEAGDKLFGFVKDMPQQLAEARQTGGDVVIPTADYATHLAGTDMDHALRGDIRVGPDGMSIREATTFFQTAREQMKTAPDFSTERDETQLGTDRVHEEILQQAKDAGYTDSTAQQYAALYAARYTARGQRLGINPYEAFQRSGVSLQGSEQTTKQSAIPAEVKTSVGTVKVSSQYDVPLLGSSGKDGTVYIQKGWDPVIRSGPLKGLDRTPMLVEHEAVERKKEDEGLDYSKAHYDHAEPAEHKVLLKQLGLKAGSKKADAAIKAYEDSYKGELRAAYGKANPDVPPDLVEKPEEHPDNQKARKLLAEVNAKEGETVHAQGERGSIRFGDGKAIISLFRDRDLSTLLHESGHLWLEELKEDAAQSPEAAADLDTVMKWMGVDSADAIGTDQHEQFARAAEAYFMEGNAPSAGLADAFARFKAWMVNLYHTVAGLDVPMSDEIRGVFNRMLATDEEISHARQVEGLTPLFTSAEQSGMTTAEFAAYQKANARAEGSARESMLGKMMAKIRRERTSEYKAERARVHEDVKNEIEALPVRQAERYINRKGGTDPAPAAALKAWKASREAQHEALSAQVKTETVARAEAEGVKGIKRGQFLAKNKRLMANEAERRTLEWEQRNPRPKLPPKELDGIAELFGFGSGDALDKAIKDAGPLDDQIERETDARMAKTHGDMLTDGSIQEEALKAVHNREQEKALATELRVLGRSSGQTGLPVQVSRDWARRTLSGKTVREAISSHTYARAEAKAAKAAEAALLKGDVREAYLQKRQQVMNHALYRESLAAAEDVEKGTKLLNRYASETAIKGMDQGYLDQIHAMLERFDFRRATGPEVEARESLARWVSSQEAQGNEVAIPDKLLNEAFRQHYSQMSVDDFRGLTDSVKNIAHLGRLKQTLLDRQDKRDFQALVDEATTQLGQQPQNPARETRGLTRIDSKYLKAGEAIRSFDAILLKMEQVIDWLDNGDPNGVFNRIVFRRISDAEGVENDLKKRVSGRLRDLSKAVQKDGRDWNTIHTFPELPRNLPGHEGSPSELRHSELISVALNWGNDSNREKLLKGEGWERGVVQSVLDRTLSKSDWDFVQGVWDIYEQELWPEKQALTKRLTGLDPERVEVSPVTTPHGQYRGGYYPMMYDPLRAWDVEQRRQRGADQLFENNYTRATTDTGSTIKRVEKYARPVDLNLNAMARHMSGEIHDIAYREAIIDADHFLANKDVRLSVERTLGREIYKQFRPWLQGIANDHNYDARGLAWFDKVAHWGRTRATMVGLGFRLSTMLLHGGSALSTSIGELGPRWMASGANAFFGPGKMKAGYDFVTARSSEMRHRMQNVDRDVRDGLRDLEGKTGLGTWVRSKAYYGISMLDMASAMPTWMGAYNKGLHDGLAEQDAIYAADKSVRNAHGGGGAKDMAAIQRGTEFQKLFTMFYTFWNHMYNRERDIGRKTKQLVTGQSSAPARDFAMVLQRSFFYFAVPTLIHALVKGGAPAEGDDGPSMATWLAESMVASVASGLPVVRDVATALEQGRDYEPTPAASAVTALLQTGKDIKHKLNDEPVSDKWIRHAVETTGYTFGLPLGQVATSTQFLWDVMHGDQDPQSVSDWVEGISKGKIDS